MALELDADRRDRLIRELRGLFLERFDDEISEFRAAEILEFFLAALGPQVYNQGVQDARKFLIDKLDDLDGEVHEPDGT